MYVCMYVFVCLSGMALSNASLLDEATAAAEAMSMCYSLKNMKKRSVKYVCMYVCMQLNVCKAVRFLSENIHTYIHTLHNIYTKIYLYLRAYIHT